MPRMAWRSFLFIWKQSLLIEEVAFLLARGYILAPGNGRRRENGRGIEEWHLSGSYLDRPQFHAFRMFSWREIGWQRIRSTVEFIFGK